MRGGSITGLVPWLMAFLVLTIAGERLELARVAFVGRRAEGGLLIAAAVLGTGVVASVPAPDAGWRLAGLGMLTLAVWLAVYDVARRTVRARRLPRYAAVCLLSGYAWLAGVIWAGYGLPGGEGGYDAALHAVFLGFVMSMVFGHAPVILPAVLRLRLPYHRLLYAPVVVLHVALLVRVAGDLLGAAPARTAGGVLGEAALLAFVVCAVAAAGRTLAAKLLLFVGVMAAAAVHGWANSAGHAGFARAMALTSLIGSVGIVLLATALPTT